MENINTILNTNRVGTLATLNADGSPWATPVHVFSDDDAVYWFSLAMHQHSENIARDPRVSLSLWSNQNGTFGAYISGAVEVLDDDARAQILARVEADLGGLPPFFEGTTGYRLPIGEINRGKSSEKRWYFYTEKPSTNAISGV